VTQRCDKSIKNDFDCYVTPRCHKTIKMRHFRPDNHIPVVSNDGSGFDYVGVTMASLSHDSVNCGRRTGHRSRLPLY
jgi:hypothetical protein